MQYISALSPTSLGSGWGWDFKGRGDPSQVGQGWDGHDGKEIWGHSLCGSPSAIPAG